MKTLLSGFFENKTKVLLALILPAVILYAKSLNFDFTTMDEQWMIARNAPYFEKSESFFDAFTTSLAGDYYRPFLLLSILLDYHIGHLHPYIYHLSNLLYHLISVVLVYRFLIILEVPVKNAFLFSLLFSLHPLALHAVVWVPGRNDLILCVFMLASFINLARYFLNPKFRYTIFHLLFFVCALLTKESAIMLPFLYITLGLAIKKMKIKQAVFLSLLWLAVSVTWLLVRSAVAGKIPATQQSPAENFINAITGFLLFTGKLIIPVQQSVLPITENVSLIPGILTFVIFLVLVFNPGVKNKAIAVFGLLVFVFMLVVPVWFSSGRNGGEHYEHRAYASITGVILFFSQVKFNFNSKIVGYVIVSFIAFFFIKTWIRMDVYKDKYNFVENAVRERPDFYLFHYQMGEALHDRNRNDEAIPYLNTAISIRPDLAKIYNARGSAYYCLNKYKEAVVDFNMAIQKSKAFDSDYLLNRCVALYRLGDVEKAMRDLVILIGCCRNILPPNFERDLTNAWLDNLHGLDKKIESDPENAVLYFKRSQLLSDVGEKEKAFRDLKKASELDPENLEYQNILAKKYME